MSNIHISPLWIETLQLNPLLVRASCPLTIRPNSESGSLTRKSKEEEEEETSCLIFEVLTEMNMDNMIFWHVMPCILVEVYRHFRRIILLDFCLVVVLVNHESRLPVF